MGLGCKKQRTPQLTKIRGSKKYVLFRNEKKKKERNVKRTSFDRSSPGLMILES